MRYCSQPVRSQTTAPDVSALLSNTNGYYSTASGFGALGFNQGGATNTADGAQALMANIRGNGNTASGLGALRLSQSGNYNVVDLSYWPPDIPPQRPDALTALSGRLVGGKVRQN